MPSIGAILSTARNAMLAQQAAVQVTSHNIANASTDGYSRQRAMLATASPLVHPLGSFGTGVVVHDISRVRDSLLDTSFRESTSGSSFASRRFDLLSQVEGMFMEPSEHGLGATMDAFFDSWSDLANNPTNATARTVVRESASRVIAQFQRLAAGIDQVRASGELRLKQDVNELNTLTAQVAELNVRILATESGGNSAPDLRDARDRAIDKLSTLVPVEVHQRSDGSIGVSANGVLLADAGGSTPLEARSSGTRWALVARGTPVTIDGGSLGATLGVLNGDLPDLRTDLDKMARSFAEMVNQIHSEGTTPKHEPGGDFFVFTGATGFNASSLALNPTIIADTRNIAAGSGTVIDDQPVYLAGASDIARRIADLRDATLIPSLADREGDPGMTVSDFYGRLVTGVGSTVRTSADNHAVQETLASQADLRRSSISGVSIDEELVALIRFQNSYSAAARMISVADEMMQTILGLAR